jgi:signal peptidase I
MLDTNYGWSILYDHNLGTISQTTNNSGYTSMFIDNYSGYSPTEEYFVPYTTQEITEDSYENDGYLDWTYDSMHNFIWAQPNAPYGSLMPTYWLSSGWTVTGLNVFSGCTSCLEAISTYNILTGSSINHGVIPTPTPTPTPSPTPTPLPLGPMRGSLLFTFNETPNYPGISSYDVFVNGQRRVLSHYNNTNIYTTYIYSGDTVLITTSEQNNFDVVRRDYTTDDQGGDNGIRDTQITGTTGQYSITFVVDIIPQDYNFEYRVIGITFGSRANIITQNYFDILTEDGKELITQQNI